jgi:GR25 family glycosyltransferase involved in LPS biosynthesis
MLLDNIYVVNLNVSSDRLKKIKQNFDLYNIKFRRFSAVYGKTLGTDEIVKHTSSLCRNLLCNYGIIGCAMSHKKLWEQLLNDKTTDRYLICEDDIIIDDKFVDIIKKIEPMLDTYNVDILSLFNSGATLHGKEVFRIDDYVFKKPFFPLSTSGYIISKGAVKKILGAYDKINYHIDFQISSMMLSNEIDINYLSASPDIIKLDLNSESTIGKTNNSLIMMLLNRAFPHLNWVMTIPVVTIKLDYTLNIYFFVLILLAYINYKKYNNIYLYTFIFIELCVYIKGFKC